MSKAELTEFNDSGFFSPQESISLNLRSEYGWLEKYEFFWFYCDYAWWTAEKGVIGWRLLKRNKINGHFIDIKTGYDFGHNLRRELIYPTFKTKNND